MGGSNPISKAASWVTNQTGGSSGLIGRIVNNDPTVRLAQGRPTSPIWSYMGAKDPGAPGSQPAPVQIGISGTAGGAGQTDDTGAELYGKYINKAAMDDLASGRSVNTNALLAQAMDMSKGLSGKEMGALRSNALSQVNQQNQAALGDLRGQMASQGIRGGLAAGLNAQQQAKSVDAVSGLERNLVADNVGFKTQGLQNAAMLNTNQENIERDLMRGRLETILTLRGQNMGLQGAQMQAQAAANAGQRGKK